MDKEYVLINSKTQSARKEATFMIQPHKSLR